MMPNRDDASIDRLATLFNLPAFWAGAIKAREDVRQHDDGISRLRAMHEVAANGHDVTATREFARWLAY